MAAPTYTPNAAGNGFNTTIAGNGSTTGTFDIDASTKFEAQLNVKAKWTAIAVTTGLKIEVFRRYGSGPTNPVGTTTNPAANFTFTIAGVTGAVDQYSPAIFLPTGKWHVVMTNLDTANTATVEATFDTIDTVA